MSWMHLKCIWMSTTIHWQVRGADWRFRASELSRNAAFSQALNILTTRASNLSHSNVLLCSASICWVLSLLSCRWKTAGAIAGSYLDLQTSFTRFPKHPWCPCNCIQVHSIHFIFSIQHNTQHRTIINAIVDHRQCFMHTCRILDNTKLPGLHEVKKNTEALARTVPFFWLCTSSIWYLPKVRRLSWWLCEAYGQEMPRVGPMIEVKEAGRFRHVSSAHVGESDASHLFLHLLGRRPVRTRWDGLSLGCVFFALFKVML